MHEWRALGDDASGSDAQRAARATRVKCMAEAVPGAEFGAYWGLLGLFYGENRRREPQEPHDFGGLF